MFAPSKKTIMKKIITLLTVFYCIIINAQTPITQANFETAINTCLSTNPVDGLCTTSEYGAMKYWDVSQVTDMTVAFKNKYDFNGDISSWDVSKVTNMSFMFMGASSFNQDIGSWDVISVTDMNYMFAIATAFNQDISGWCVTSIGSEPDYFTQGSPLSGSNKPVWGSCTAAWTGITDNDWYTATNWDTPTVPNTSRDITIPSGLTNYPTATRAV